jgi:hypothetical protein
MGRTIQKGNESNILTSLSAWPQEAHRVIGDVCSEAQRDVVRYTWTASQAPAHQTPQAETHGGTTLSLRYLIAELSTWVV